MLAWVGSYCLGRTGLELLHGDFEGVHFFERSDQIVDEGCANDSAVFFIVQLLLQLFLDAHEDFPVPDFSPDFFQVSFGSFVLSPLATLFGTLATTLDHPDDF